MMFISVLVAGSACHGYVWKQLVADGPGTCMDSNGGGLLTDTYPCVPINASDIMNEL